MKKSILRVSMMLFMASMTMTSCDDFWDDVFGEESTPTTPSTPKDDGTSITKTPTGAEATVESLAEITEMLGNVKGDIAAKEGEEYVFEVKNEELETTTTDNVIEVPKVENSNINLTFTNNVSTETTLIVKATETASDIPTKAVNALTITMPTSKGLSLELNMPETTVTLKAASGEVIYDEVVATTALNTLYIEKGVTVKNLQVKGGVVVVKEGGIAETYVYEPVNNQDTIIKYKAGIEPIYVEDVSGKIVPSVQDANGKIYYFNNLKIIKGTADYANINFRNGTYPIDKLTLAEGVVAKADGGTFLSARVVEGEGYGAELIMTVNNNHISMEYVTEMKGISLSLEPETTTVETVFVTNVPDQLENCTLNFHEVDFRDSQTVAGSIKGCTFKGNLAYINIPIQTDEIPSYRLDFTDCDFNEGFKLNANITARIYEYDENGKTIPYEYPFYKYYDETYGMYLYAQSQDEIPEGITTWEEITDGDRPAKFSPAKYNNYNVTIGIKNCRLGGDNFTSESDFISGSYPAAGVHMRFELDGTLYEYIWDDTVFKYVLKRIE